MQILIAEDSATALAVLEGAVSALGHSCMIARDGDAAWELFVEHEPEVVISDWIMPGLDGDELCRRIREHPTSSYTYVILLTSLDAQGYIVRGMEAGADDFLRKPFDTDDLHGRLIAAARVTALYERVNAQQRELETLNRRLFEESRHDPLTGTGNRIALSEQLEQLSGRATRYGHTYCLALCDVDNFKSFNDTQGHQAGDQALRAVAGALLAGSRTGDGVYRYGGEEFLIVLPEQTLKSATAAAERARSTIAALAIPNPASVAHGVLTISTGVARLEQADDGDFAVVLKRADLALYRAKQLGRNRVCSDLD
jgi:two-component system cell cycle response regulator